MQLLDKSFNPTAKKFFRQFGFQKIAPKKNKFISDFKTSRQLNYFFITDNLAPQNSFQPS